MKTRFKIIFWLLFLLFCLVLGVSEAKAQVIFTEAELMQIAKHNLERKECLKLQEQHLRDIDTLNLKVDILTNQGALKDSLLSNQATMLNNYEQIDKLQNKAINTLETERDDTKRLVKKLNRRLTFWRIFTPITVTATAILGLLL